MLGSSSRLLRLAFRGLALPVKSGNSAGRIRTRRTRVRDAVEPLEGRLLPAISFGPGTGYGVGGGLIAVGDFNRDGKPDLATPTQGTGGTVSILLNLGGGTFTTPASVVTGLPDVTGMAVGDISGDGKADIVVADGKNGELAVVPGRGDGTFGSPTIVSDPNSSFTQPTTVKTRGGDLTLADVNSDGKLDILIPSSTGTDLFLNRGNGTFDLHTSVAPFPVFTFADFDGNGTVDLAGITFDLNSSTSVVKLNVSRGNGDGTFAAPVLSPLPGNGLAVDLATLSAREYLADGTTIPADLNHDGHPDLVFSGYGAGVDVLLNDGKGSFAMPAANDLSESVTVIADFNGDSEPEVGSSPRFTDDNSDNPLLVLPNDGDGTLGAPVRIGNPITPLINELVAADFDGDGKLDIAYAIASTAGAGVGVVLTGFHTPPTLSPIANQSVAGGGTVPLQASASDIDPRAVITYSASVGTINPRTGAFSYAATALGTVPVTITATVANASPPVSVSRSFQITVKAPPPPGVLLLSPFPIAVAGAAWTASSLYFAGPAGVSRASADYGDGTGASPLALTGPADFTLAHTYAFPGKYTITVSLADAYGSTGTATTTLTVDPGSEGSGTGGSGSGSSGAHPVRVTSITTTMAKGAITAFNVQFDGDVVNAADPSHYSLLFVKSRRVRKKVVTNTTRIRIASVSFDAAADVARIVPARRLVPGKVNELTINTAALLDSSGHPLGGGLIADIRGKVVAIR